MEWKIAYEYHHFGAKKIKDIIYKREKSPETLRLIDRRQETTKASNLRFKLVKSLNRKVWLHRRTGKRGRNEVAIIDLDLFFRDERNRWGGGNFELNEPTASTNTKRNTSSKRSKQELSENVLSIGEGEVVRPTISFCIVDLKDCNVAEKTILYIQMNHMIERTKIANAEAEENLTKAEFSFTADWKTLIHKTSVDPKVLQLKICHQITKTSEPPKNLLQFSPNSQNDSVYHLHATKL